MNKFPFAKYQGAGNDFVLMDFSRSEPSLDLPELARVLCDRRHGVGADGLLLLLSSTVADYRMRIFNADGSEPSMCGNGIRCLASYILKHNHSLSEVNIETGHAVLKCRKVEGEIAVNLGTPVVLHWPIEIEEAVLYVVNTGVPHAVIFVDDLDKIEIGEWGRHFRFHPFFAPDGVNVNFASVTKDDQVALRTYERGVEAETLACGTGAAAAAFVAMRLKNLKAPVSVLTRSSFDPLTIAYQQQLRFFFSGKDTERCAIEMIGSSDEVFDGAIDLKLL